MPLVRRRKRQAAKKKNMIPQPTLNRFFCATERAMGRMTEKKTQEISRTAALVSSFIMLVFLFLIECYITIVSCFRLFVC